MVARYWSAGMTPRRPVTFFQEAFERDLNHVVVTKLRVCLGGDGAEVFPMILFPEGTDEPVFCVKPGAVD